MALRGTGAVAIWHDIAPEGRRAFYDWHGREHMLERVGIKGFSRGRRYIATDADLEYFNLYEAQNIEVLRGPDYQTRLNDPTPWTVETVKHFRKVNRSLCTVVRSEGIGGGGLIATVRYDANADLDAELWDGVLAAMAAEDGIAGVHLLVADVDASAVDTAERKARGEANTIPTRAILVEGWGDEPAFHDLCKNTLSSTALQSHGIEGPIASGQYRLQLTIDDKA